MRKTVTKLKATTFATVAVLMLVGVTVMCNQQKAGPSAAQQKQLATLKDLRDSGVLSEDEYQAKSQAIAAAAPAPAPKSGSLFGGGTRSVEVTDPVLNMTAANVEIPADWKFAGTVARAPGCTSSGAAIKYTAQSADGSVAAEMLPGYSWVWYSDPNMANGMKQRGCAVLPIITAADFLKQVMIPNLRPNAKVIDVGQVAPAFQAAIEAQLQKRREANAQMAAQYHQPPQQLVYEGARARISYARAGQPVEEALVAVIQCTISHQPAIYARAASQSNQCSTVVMGVQRAPQGKLDAMQPVFAAIKPQINSAWDQKMSQIIQQQGQQAINASWQAHNAMMKNSADAAAARSRQAQTFMQNQRQQTDRFLAQDAARQEAMHQSAIKTENMSLGVQTYANPATGTVSNASNQYNHTWQRSSDGTMIQTNDPTFDPRGSDRLNETWTEMEAVK